MKLTIPKNYFARAVANLQLGGIAIYDIKYSALKYLYFTYSAFMLIVFVYMYTVAEIIHVVEMLGGEEDLLFTVSYLVAHLIGCAKITVLLLRRKSIGNFLKALEEGRFLPNINRGGLKEISFIQQAISKTKLQITSFWILIFVMLSNRMIWIARNLTSQQNFPENSNTTVTIRQFPYATSYIIPFDMQKSPFYELVFVHQTVSTWFFGWYMGNADSITNGLMIHLTAQFKIVSNAFVNVVNRAEKLTQKSVGESQSNKVQKIKLFSAKCKHVVEVQEIQKYNKKLLENLKRCLIDCIQHHQETLNLAEHMENTFNLMLLIQFMGCLVLFCFQLYQLSLLAAGSTSFISMCFFMLASMWQVLFFCWNGNEMSIASEAIADAVHNINWIPADKTVKDFILMTIMRAQKPVHVTAGKFSNLSMVTFVAILRGSFSYFTVLRKVNNVEEE